MLFISLFYFQLLNQKLLLSNRINLEMIKEFNLQFKDLDVAPKDLEVLMGFDQNEVPEPFPELIMQAIGKAPELFDIRGGYKFFENVKVDLSSKTIRIEELVFSPTKIIITQLKKATSCLLFVCTAGARISEYAKELENDGDFILSYVYDVLGSIVADKAMDKIQKEIEVVFRNKNLRISDRYSPGYCDWSVAEQQKLFSLLPLNFCGIKLSTSSLMTPIKSVSGIIGIGTEVEQKGYQCIWCNDQSCIYGKIKRQKKD